MARVACTVMLKDEVTLTAPFLDYHAALFGAANVYVVDNGTTEPEVLAVLERFERAGGHVDRSFPMKEDYLRKGEIVSDLVKRLDAKADYDLYLLLDCDEFVVVRDGSGFSCDPADIHRILDSMVGGSRIFRVGVNLSNIPGRQGAFQVAEYAKTIFPRNTLGATDHGHHAGWTRDGNSDFVPCDVAYVHFHYRPHDEVVRFARQKLAVEMPPEDLDDPKKLRAFKGRGWHLVNHVLAGPEAYYAQFQDVRTPYAFPELASRFRAVGSEMPFSAFSLADAEAVVPEVTVMVDEATATRVRGWAWNAAAPQEATFLTFRVNGDIMWSGICDQPRPDVRGSGIPTEAVGFNFALESGSARGAVLTAEDASGRRLRMTTGSLSRDEYPLVEALPSGDPASMGEIYSHVDSFRNGRIQGWALRSIPTPEGPRLLGGCTIAVIYEGRVVARAVAGISRPDVSVAMQSDDRCGFLVNVPRHVAAPERSATFRLTVMPENQEIAGSPCIAAPMFPKTDLDVFAA